MTDGRLLHYTTTPLVEVRSVTQGEPGSRYDKPTGLWLSVEGEDDWRSWCESEEYGNPAAQLCYEVELAPAANVLRLETPTALLDFTGEYGVDPYMGPMAGRTMMFAHGINWPVVAERYAGIIITPYQRGLRFDERTHWYYGWDCASGCIWDSRAAARIAAVPNR